MATRSKRRKKQRKAGYVYILTSSALKANWLKIGKTTRTPRERAAEISRATGVPVPYEVVFEVPVSDCHAAEKAIHRALNKKRAASNREFFVLPLPKAIDVVTDIASRYQTASWRRAMLHARGRRGRGVGVVLELVPGFFLQTFGLGHLVQGRLAWGVGLMLGWWAWLLTCLGVILSSDSHAGYHMLIVGWPVWAIFAAAHAARGR